MGFQEILFRLLAAFAAGGLVGLERQIHGRPAGLRTHILVSTGACIAIVAAVLAHERLPHLSLDLGRIAAGVITGVGFLGAGTIVRYRDGVGGLTTAACVWFVAMTGILAGLGFYEFTALASVLALVVLLLLDRLETRIPEASYWKLRVRFTDRQLPGIRSDCIELLQGHGIKVKGSTMSISESSTEMTFLLKTRHREENLSLLDKMSKIPGLVSVKWTHRSEET